MSQLEEKKCKDCGTYFPTDHLKDGFCPSCWEKNQEETVIDVIKPTLVSFKYKINNIDNEYQINGKSVSLEEFKAFCKKNSPPKVKFYECPKIQGYPMDPISCMFCPFGHMTECHYPDNCREAQCEHYKSAYNQEES